MRLVSLIAFAIALILILIFAVRSCESSNESAAYKSYMDKVGKIASDSQSVGKGLSKLLARQELSQTVVETTLKGLISQQRIDIENASKLTPPGPLRKQNEQMIEALQFRENALNGLLEVFKETMSKRGNTAANKAGIALSQQMQRGVASDVIWQDMFIAPAQEVLKSEGISGVAPPSSVFIADSQIATYNSMSLVWQRFHGVQTTNTSGSIHGTNIAYLKVLPSGKILNAGITQVIKTSDRLAFAVGVENGGDFLEQNIKVTLKIGQSPDPIVKTLTIAQIYPKAQQQVVFRSLAVTELANKIPVSVDVQRVTGEVRVDNNVATYEVRFTF